MSGRSDQEEWCVALVVFLLVGCVKQTASCDNADTADCE